MIIWSSRIDNKENINGITITETPTSAAWGSALCHSTLTCAEKPANGIEYKNGWWAGAKTFTFSTSITNPYLILFSMGNSIGLGANLIINTSATVEIYCNTTSGGCSASPTSTGVQLSGTNILYGKEAFGIVKFPGVHSDITLTLSGATGDSGSYRWGADSLYIPTPTPTSSPTITPTPSVTIGLTPTASPTPKPTKTPLTSQMISIDCCPLDRSPTPTTSITSSVTPTPTVTSSFTPTPTNTTTYTPTPTITKTVTPTRTVTKTASVTPTKSKPVA